MSKVTLLAINSKYVHSSLAVWVIAGGVSEYARLPHDVNIIETTIQQSCGEIAGRVALCNPDVVGISAYIWNAGKLPELLETLRELLPGAVIVLGGPEAEHNAKYWTGKGADYVLSGEGERSFPALLDFISSALPCDTLSSSVQPDPIRRDKYNNALYNDRLSPGSPNGALLSPADMARDHEPVNPYNDVYFRSLGGRIAYLETSRGCPYKCAFCLSGGTGVRFFPMEQAKKQILQLSRSGTRTIKFVDRTFNCDAGRAYELFEYVIGLDTPCKFHFEVAADLFDERTLELLASAPPGRIQLEAGLQSFYKPALTASFREMNLEKAEDNIHSLLRGQNIHIHVDLIAGLPYEMLADFQNSFDRAYALGAHTLQLGFLKLLHGSALREYAETLGIEYDMDPPYEIICSTALSTGDLHILKQVENALSHTYNKGRFLSTLEYVLNASRMRPFALFRKLGAAAPNNGAQLPDYAVRVYEHFSGLSGVDEHELRECMISDWLRMVKGENMPPVLGAQDKRRWQVAAVAEKQLGHGVSRNEAVVLPSGKGAFVDSENRDPVTGLYRLHII